MNITTNSFPPSQPFTPYQQLMSVLPRESSSLLPAPFQKLMMDKQGPLALYFPSKLEIDKNGKKNSWESIIVLPFIDEKVLTAAFQTIDPKTLSSLELE